MSRITSWFHGKGVRKPNDITVQLVRDFLSELVVAGYADTYVHIHARVLKTFSNFLFDEGYISHPIDFPMPKLGKIMKRVYGRSEIHQILAACQTNRDRSFILLPIDSRIRLSEAIALNWADINTQSGIIQIQSGKGRKSRVSVISIRTRRTFVKYQTDIDSSDEIPVIQTIDGRRLTESGVHSWMNRLSEKAQVHISSHALRRTFATFALRAGMDLFSLQRLMGHSNLSMTREYVSQLTSDLAIAHQNHSPVDFIIKS